MPTKVCTKCNKRKNTSQFYKGKNGTLRSWCKECSSNKALENYYKKRENYKQYYKNNRKKLLEYSIEYKQRPENKERVRLQNRKRRLKEYNLTLEGYRELFKKQKGVCYICQRPSKKGNLCVDHCHVTGEVR